MAPLTEKDKTELKAQFEEMDTDKSGTLSKEEIKAAHEKIGIEMPEDFLNDLFKDMDTDGNGKVKFLEFLDACK